MSNTFGVCVRLCRLRGVGGQPRTVTQPDLAAGAFLVTKQPRPNATHWLFLRFLAIDFAALWVMLTITAAQPPGAGWVRSMLDHLLWLQVAAVLVVLLALQAVRAARWMLSATSRHDVKLGWLGRFPLSGSALVPTPLMVAQHQLPPGPHDVGFGLHVRWTLMRTAFLVPMCVFLALGSAFLSKGTVVLSPCLWWWTLGGVVELLLGMMGLHVRWIEANGPTSYLAGFMGIVRTVPAARVAAMIDAADQSLVIDVDGAFSIRTSAAIAPTRDDDETPAAPQ